MSGIGLSFLHRNLGLVWFGLTNAGHWLKSEPSPCPGLGVWWEQMVPCIGKAVEKVTQVGILWGWDWNLGIASPFPLVDQNLPFTLPALDCKHQWFWPQRSKVSKATIAMPMTLTKVVPFLPFAGQSHWFIYSASIYWALQWPARCYVLWRKIQERCKENINSVQHTHTEHLLCSEQ